MELATYLDALDISYPFRMRVGTSTVERACKVVGEAAQVIASMVTQYTSGKVLLAQWLNRVHSAVAMATAEARRTTSSQPRRADQSPQPTGRASQ